jgi:hypothetical protein
MTRLKLLSAAAILSTVAAAPGLAQARTHLHPYSLPLPDQLQSQLWARSAARHVRLL